ncbi:MAG: serpin family protein [Eubacteriales bacterium]|nr:serpin family protein [Eubacteriales bacterium]
MIRNKKTTCILSLVFIFSLMLCGCGKTDNDIKATETSVNAGIDEVQNETATKSDVKYPEIPSDDEELERYIEDNRPSEEEIEEIQDFSWETTSKLISNTGVNENYSPASLYFALSLLAAGAEGETADELYELLNIDSREALIARSSKLFRWLSIFEDPRYSSETSDLKIANSLWLQNGINFKEEYKNTAINDFYSGIFNVDFKDQETGKQISAWINEHTEGLLNPEIQFSPETLMSIVNTVYFYAEWQDGFDKNNTFEGDFYISNVDNSSGLKRDFMKQEVMSKFYKGDGFTRSELKLKNRSKMIFVLPDKGEDIDSFIQDADRLEDVFTKGEDSNVMVNWEIPKFGFDSSYDITAKIKALGIEQICSPLADFSYITDEEISVDKISQETHIGLDENGVEAASYTIVQLIESAMLPDDKAEMILNRPFLYAIMTNDGIPLFIGTYRGSEDMLICGTEE